MRIGIWLHGVVIAVSRGSSTKRPMRNAIPIEGTLHTRFAGIVTVMILMMLLVDMASADRVNKQIVGPLPAGNFIVRYEILSDSKHVSYSIGGWDPSGPITQVGLVPITGSSAPLQISGTFQAASLDAKYWIYISSGRLYSQPTAGGAPTDLDNGSVKQFWISPDSSRVVYSRESVGLFSIPIAGGVPSQLAEGTFISVQISPDSSRVLYAPGTTDYMGLKLDALFSVPIAGGASVQLNGSLVSGGKISHVVIAPDSSRVIYVADQETDELRELYSVPLIGGAVVKLNNPLTAGFQVSPYLPCAISPDSSRVVYPLYGPGYQESLYSVPIAGGASAPLSDPLIGVRDSINYVISSDSRYVVYGAYMIGPGGVERMYSVPIAGGPAVDLSGPLTPNGNIYSLGISPDNMHVVYHADQDVDGVCEIYSSAITGGPPVKLNGAVVSGGAGCGGYYRRFKISPDSVYVVYQIDQDISGVTELYSVPIIGGTPVKLNPALMSGRRVGTYGITADSRRVLYVANQETASRTELFDVPITGGATNKLSGPLADGREVDSFRVSLDGPFLVYGVNAAGSPQPDGLFVTYAELNQRLYLPLVSRQ